MPASRYYARLKDKVEDAVDMVGDAVSDVAESVSRDILQLSDTVDQQEVDMPTPPACFYTPDDGWLTQPAGASEAWKPPANLTDLRCYWPNAVLGELQIEVLQAEDLPSARFGLGRIDPYALILHERMSARTSTVWNNDHPKWSALSSARGFRLPITSPYSSVFVAVQDDNHVHDEPLGRIAIHLGSYRPNTEYDCWFSLQHSPMAKHSSKYGAVRIRFSVRFHDNRRRVLEVIPQLPGPSYVADFHRGASRKAAAYAYRGGRYYSKRRFRWRILQSYVNELRDSAEALIARVRAVLFWQLPLMSFSLLVGFQLLVTYPWAVGASIPLTALIVLQRNLWFERPLPPIRSRMSICGIMLMALLNRSPEPLSASPTGCGTDDSDSEGKSSGEDDDEEEADGEAAVTRELTRVGASKASLRPPRSASELLTASVSRFGERLRVLIRGNPGHSYADVKAKIAAEVEELVQEEWEDAMEQEDAKLGEERLQKPSVYRHLVDPLDAILAAALGPVQDLCEGALIYVRAIRRVFEWEERTVSLLAYVVLAVATLALLAFGYALSLIWVALVEWSLRLLGLAAFGPHMYYVGQYVESLEQDERDKAWAYEAASSAERQAIRGALTAELLEERRKRLQEELARHITQVNKTPKHGLLVQPRPNAGREKFLHHPIVSRSRASPLPPAIVLE